MSSNIQLNSEQREKLQLALNVSVMKGDIDKVSKFLRGGANPNGLSEGVFPLHGAIVRLHLAEEITAVERRIVAIISLLLNSGASPSLSLRGDSPLHLASLIKNSELREIVVTLLMKHEAKPIEGKRERYIVSEIAKEERIIERLHESEVPLLELKSSSRCCTIL